MARGLTAVLLLASVQHVFANNQAVIVGGSSSSTTLNVGSNLDPVTGFPVQSISIDDIFISYDSSSGNSKCCPRGTLYNGRTCVFPSTAVCPRGFQLSGNVCVGIAACPGDLVLVDGLCAAPGDPDCEHTGSIFNRDTHLCESSAEPSCVLPFEMRDSKCIAPEGPECKTGSRLKGQRCISNTSPICNPATLHLDDKGRCVSSPECPPGTHMKDGSVCESFFPPRCANPKYTFDNGDCVLEEDPTCPPGAKLEQNVCQFDAPPTCYHGEYDNGSCVSKDPPRCPSSRHVLEGGVCRLSEVPFCHAGDDLFFIEGTERRAICCPTGSKPNTDGDTCLTEVTEEGECEDPMHWDPYSEKCFYTPGPGDCPAGFAYHAQRGECIKTTQPVCDKGSLFNGKCHIDEQPKCKDTAKFDPATGACIGAPPTCPDGSFLSGDRCVAINGDPKCEAPDTELVNGKCVAKGKPKCPGDSVLEGGVCVGPDHKPYCPHPNRLEGNVCIVPGDPGCPAGTKLQGDDCVSVKDPLCEPPFQFVTGTNKCVAPGGPNCGPRFHFNPAIGRCVTGVPPVCPANSQFVVAKGKCVSHNNPSCPEGRPDGQGNCVHDDEPKCPDEDTVLFDGACVSKFDPDCPPDTTLDRATRSCIYDKPPACPEGTDLVGTICVARTKPECPRGMKPVGAKCVHEEDPLCPLGFHFSKVHNKCITDEPPNCPENSFYDVVGMRCTTSSTQTCFDLRTCPPVEDFSPPGLGASSG